MNTEPKDQRVQIVASRDMIRKIDEWRRKQEDFPNRSEAIRRLIQKSLMEDSK